MTAQTDWSRDEVEAAVGNYFDILAMELRSEPFNKAEHNRRLQRLLAGRTKSAIEKKHQNISAVSAIPTSTDTNHCPIFKEASSPRSWNGV
jgi:hypothetical protein